MCRSLLSGRRLHCALDRGLHLGRLGGERVAGGAVAGAGRRPGRAGPAPASVGRNSAAHSAALCGHAYSRDAELSPQSGSGRDLLLYRKPALIGARTCWWQISTRCAIRFAECAPAHLFTSTPGSSSPTTCTVCGPRPSPGQAVAARRCPIFRAGGERSRPGSRNRCRSASRDHRP